MTYPLKTDTDHQAADTVVDLAVIVVVDLAVIVVVMVDHLPVAVEGLMTKVCLTRTFI